jgi:hypothetical protein
MHAECIQHRAIRAIRIIEAVLLVAAFLGVRNGRRYRPRHRAQQPPIPHALGGQLHDFMHARRLTPQDSETLNSNPSGGRKRGTSETAQVGNRPESCPLLPYPFGLSVLHRQLSAAEREYAAAHGSLTNGPKPTIITSLRCKYLTSFDKFF